MSFLLLKMNLVTLCTTEVTLKNSTHCLQNGISVRTDLRTNSDYFPIQH